MSEMLDLLKSLPALTGSDFTIWRTESTNYPYVFIAYSYNNEVDRRYTYQVQSPTTPGNFVYKTMQVSSGGSNAGFVLVGVTVHYYDMATTSWVQHSSSGKAGYVSKITIGEETLTGCVDNIVFSTRDIYNDSRVLTHPKDFRFLLSGRNQLDHAFTDDYVFTTEHLTQLGYEAGDHILHIKPYSGDDYLYVFKGLGETATLEITNSSSYLTFTLPTGATESKMMKRTKSSGTYAILSVATQSSANSKIDINSYISYSTLNVVFDGRLSRVADHYTPGERDQILSINESEMDFTNPTTLTGQTSPEGLEIKEVLPVAEVLNPAELKNEIIVTLQAGNSHYYEHVLVNKKPEIMPESLTVNPATIEGLIGTTHQLSVEVLPEDAEDKTVAFVTGSDRVATVDETGLVTLIGEGQTTITIQSNRVPSLTKEVAVTSIRPFDKPVINRLTVTPSNPTELDTVSIEYQVTYDRATFKAEEWEGKKERYEAGSHTVRVRVQDSNDLWSDWKEITFTVKPVYQKPVLNSLTVNPENPGYGEAVEFSFDYTLDPRLTLQKENWVNKKESYLDGTHVVKLSITDSEGQESNQLEVSFSIERPFDKPTISNLTITPVVPEAGQQVSFNYDKVIDSRLTVQSENWTNKKESYESGSHTVKLSVTDSQGQTSNELSLTFEVAYVPEVPVLTDIHITPESPIAGDPIKFGYEVDLDAKAGVKAEEWENKKESYEAGDHQVALTIVDTFDQRSNRMTFDFTVLRRKDQPVISNLTMTPLNPTTEDDIEFSYESVIDHELTLLRENWTNKQSRYPAGTHTVRLTITDSENQVSNELTLTFEVTEPVVELPPVEELPPAPDEFPLIYDIILDPPQPRANELISYSYTAAVAPGTSIVDVQWLNRQFVYPEAGTYEVTLEVKDSRGYKSSKTLEFEVAEASNTPQPPKPVRVKHLEVTRWDSAHKRFLILEGREK